MLEYIFLFYKCRVSREGQNGKVTILLFTANLFALWTQICCSWSRWLSLFSRLLHKKVTCSGPGTLDFQKDLNNACDKAPGLGKRTELQTQTCLDFNPGSACFWSWDLQQLSSFGFNFLFFKNGDNKYFFHMLVNSLSSVAIKPPANRRHTMKGLLF